MNARRSSPLVPLLVAICALVSNTANGEVDLADSIQRHDGQYHLQTGATTLVVDPAVGARVADLRHAEHSLLTERGDELNAWGSVFWPSPQSDWGWPPLPALDHQPYETQERDGALVLTSEVDERFGYQLRKTYRPGETPDSVIIDYRLYNRGESTRRVAPWEITRVPAGGLAFFPRGEGPMISGQFHPLAVEEIDGMVWFDYDASRVLEGNNKLMTDGREGWLAHVLDGYLLLKQFPEVPLEDNAPDEGEVEIFAADNHRYVELEQQGPLTELAPGEHLDWRVRWYVQKLPEEMTAEPGSETLVRHVRGILGSPL